MALGTEGNGRGLETQMRFEAQVQFFFFFHLDYTNDYLQAVDTYSHHHHWSIGSSYCSARKQQQQQGLETVHLEPPVRFF